MTVVAPPFRPVPPGATPEQRRALLAEWMAEFASLNPRHLNPDGTPRALTRLLLRLMRRFWA